MSKRSAYRLPPALVDDLTRQNPWWQSDPQPVLPVFRRWPYQVLDQRLRDPIAPIVLLRGPRQVGKTTLQEQLIAARLAAGSDPRRVLRVQVDTLPSLARITAGDEPLLRIVDWFESEVLGRHLNAAARDGEPALLFFDEVQNLPSWDVQLKTLVDHATVRALVTGSSALRIEAGRDSLAGRVETLEIGPLRLVEIAALRGFGELRPMQTANGWGDWLDRDFWTRTAAHARRQATVRDRAFAAFSERGGYPFAQTQVDRPWQEVADYFNETVVRRMVKHDLGAEDTDPRVLEEVLRLACRYAGQSPNPVTLAREIQLVLGRPVQAVEVSRHLDLLDGALLLRAIHPLEARLKKRTGHRKLCLADPMLRAAWLQEIVPLDPAELDLRDDLQVLAGWIAESVVGAYLASLVGLDVAHFPARGAEPEIDFVLTIGDRRVPVEVKYQRGVDVRRDAAGLVAFVERGVYQSPFGLLVTRDEVASEDPRVVTLPLRSLLMVR
jgi:hypothetical protein